ncbi:MAG: hypothetical protein HC906_16025 [Bacteroidales bacterium]|nr:hypothetical protein [Bacteroidales bacterium]
MKEEKLTIYFKVTNENGYQSIGRRFLMFKGGKLTETTGLKLYSANSNMTSAYNLLTLEPQMINSDSLIRDIQEFQPDTSFTNLSLNWVSPSGCTFVRLNDFDYGNASGSTVKAGYQVGTKLTEIAGISVGNIFIIKVSRAPEETYVLLKINNIIDNQGTEMISMNFR